MPYFNSVHGPDIPWICVTGMFSAITSKWRVDSPPRLQHTEDFLPCSSICSLLYGISCEVELLKVLPLRRQCHRTCCLENTESKGSISKLF